MKISVTIEGTSPLIVNRFHEEAQAEATSGVHSRHEALTPEKDAEGRLYRLPDGTTYFPAENLRQSVITAAGRHKIGRRSAATDAAAALAIWPAAIPLPYEWEVDARAVVIPATKGRLTRYRPLFPAFQGKARRGRAGRGRARQGSQGEARRGWVGPGEAGPGEAGQSGPLPPTEEGAPSASLPPALTGWEARPPLLRYSQ